MAENFIFFVIFVSASFVTPKVLILLSQVFPSSILSTPLKYPTSVINCWFFISLILGWNNCCIASNVCVSVVVYTHQGMMQINWNKSRNIYILSNIIYLLVKVYMTHKFAEICSTQLLLLQKIMWTAYVSNSSRTIFPSAKSPEHIEKYLQFKPFTFYSTRATKKCYTFTV